MTIRRLLPILILTGCGLFSRSQSKFYSLDRIPPAAPPAAVAAVPVAIDGIELPPGLDRREVVVRQADHKLEVRSAEQWSASLQPLVLHTLAFDLAARMPEGMVILPGAAKPTGAIRSVDVVLEELAAGPNPVVVLDGRWTVTEPGRGRVTQHERITVDIASLDSANIATGMSQAVGMLADRMAAQLLR
ncbi:MAG TPA: ABC-type transport auxiliary lipoprotein family protein [Thermoanaerobaculia bacterium]|nr:ABC-type transport auxiliary lipoprotein family protein [Thermoanaerobaculia bacterium]